MNSVMSVFLCDDMCIYLLLHLDCFRSGVQQENWSSLLFGCFFLFIIWFPTSRRATQRWDCDTERESDEERKRSDIRGGKLLPV